MKQKYVTKPQTAFQGQRLVNVQPQIKQKKKELLTSLHPNSLEDKQMKKSQSQNTSSKIQNIVQEPNKLPVIIQKIDIPKTIVPEIKANQNIQLVQNVTDNQKLVVLIGQIGSGKTTLFNRISKANCETAPGGPSVTQNIFSKNSAYGMGFKILDTPGLGVYSNKIIHACAIRSALSEGSINRIIIVLKVERTDQMRNYLNNMLRYQFQRFKNIITVAITHWDNIETSKPEFVSKTQKEIEEMIKSFNVHSILFVSPKTEIKKICNQIDIILQSSESTNAKITDTEFYSHFDLLECSDHIEIKLIDAKAKLSYEFRILSKHLRKYISEFDDQNPLMPDVMHALTIDIKNFAQQIISKFEEENFKQFTQLFETLNDPNMTFLIDIELKKELMADVNQLIQMAQKKMKFNSDHCFNYIKRCPYCNIVWLKVLGCDGETQCGFFPEQDYKEFQISQVPRKFKFNISLEKVELIQCDMENQLKEKNYKDPGNALRGCGKKFIWSDLPQLSAAEMMDLIDPGIQDYLAKQVDQKKEKLRFSLEQQVLKATQQVKRIEL